MKAQSAQWLSSFAKLRQSERSYVPTAALLKFKFQHTVKLLLLQDTVDAAKLAELVSTSSTDITEGNILSPEYRSLSSDDVTEALGNALLKQFYNALLNGFSPDPVKRSPLISLFVSLVSGPNPVHFPELIAKVMHQLTCMVNFAEEFSSAAQQTAVPGDVAVAVGWLTKPCPAQEKHFIPSFEDQLINAFQIPLKHEKTKLAEWCIYVRLLQEPVMKLMQNELRISLLKTALDEFEWADVSKLVFVLAGNPTTTDHPVVKAAFAALETVRDTYDSECLASLKSSDFVALRSFLQRFKAAQTVNSQQARCNYNGS